MYLKSKYDDTDIDKISQKETKTLELNAKELYHESGWYLEAGETYRFYVVEKKPLYDRNIPSPGVGGFNSAFPKSWIKRFIMKLFEPFRRRPHDNWLALVGGVKAENESIKQINVKSDNFFLIENETEIKVHTSGEFICFFNDVKFMYYNNKGSVSITIQKV
ncbi:MAG: hypothetical protein U9O24_04655 [Campylobacterota bacterium]|nr:hypothetical protein [Campylobacterota bacterium]